MGGSGAKRRRQDQRQPLATTTVASSSSSSTTVVDEPPKKKSKKPKHLHRKLQQAQDDLAQQEVLRKALLELENAKKQKQKKQQQKSKPKEEPAPLEQPPRKEPEQTTQQGSNSLTKLLFPTKASQQAAPTRQLETKEPAAPKLNNTVTNEASPPSPKLVTEEVKDLDNSKQSNKDDANDEDDDAINLEAPARRQRGKRRRGRQSTSEITESQTAAATITTAPATEVPLPTFTTKKSKRESKAIISEENTRNHDETKSIDPNATSSETIKSKRYCHGRKPITDFVLGQSYPGKVVYVKDFGIFVDINCHVDAFCHVSRLSDAFVASPHELYQPGDVIPAARIVDLERKRITISLQSEKMQEQEAASRNARQERKSLRSRKNHAQKENKKVQSSQSPESRTKVKSPAGSTGIAAASSKLLPAKEPIRAQPPSVDPASGVTPAELKRLRKLERRAARRASAGEEQVVVSQ